MSKVKKRVHSGETKLGYPIHNLSAPFVQPKWKGDLQAAYCSGGDDDVSEGAQIIAYPLAMPGWEARLTGYQTRAGSQSIDESGDFEYQSSTLSATEIPDLDNLTFDDLMQMRYNHYSTLQALHNQYMEDKLPPESPPPHEPQTHRSTTTANSTNPKSPRQLELQSILSTHDEHKVLNWVWSDLKQFSRSDDSLGDCVSVEWVVQYFACQPELREYFCLLEFDYVRVINTFVSEKPGFVNSLEFGVLMKRASVWSQQRAVAVRPSDRREPPRVPRFLEDNSPKTAKRTLMVGQKVISELNRVFSRSATLSVDSGDEEVDLIEFIEQIKQVPALMELLRVRIVKAHDMGIELTLDQVLQSALDSARKDSPDSRPKMTRKEFFELLTDQDILETSPEATMKIVEQRLKHIYNKLSSNGTKVVSRSEMMRAIQNDQMILRRRKQQLMPKHLTHDIFREATVDDLIGQLSINLPDVIDASSFVHSVRKTLIRPGQHLQIGKDEFITNDDAMFPDYMKLLSPRKPKKPEFNFQLNPAPHKPSPPQPAPKTPDQQPSPPEMSPDLKPYPTAPIKKRSQPSLADLPPNPPPPTITPPTLPQQPPNQTLNKLPPASLPLQPTPQPTTPSNPKLQPAPSILTQPPPSSLDPAVIALIRSVFAHTPALLATFADKHKRQLSANIVRRVSQFKPLTREQLEKSKEKLKEQQAGQLLAQRLREGVESSLRESSRSKNSGIMDSKRSNFWNPSINGGNADDDREDGSRLVQTDDSRYKKIRMIELIKKDQALSKQSRDASKDWVKTLKPQDRALLAEARVLNAQGKLL